MTKDEAMKLALNFLEDGMPADMWGMDENSYQNAITALRQALEQPDAIEAAVRAENEACAKVADSISDKYAFGFYGNEVDTADEIASAIRARMKS